MRRRLGPEGPGLMIDVLKIVKHGCLTWNINISRQNAAGFSMNFVILDMHTFGHVNHVAKLESS